MAYATSSDLQRYGLPAGVASSFAVGDINGQLDAASILADGFLSGPFTLPISTWGADLTQAVCKIAAYELLAQRGYNPEGDQGLAKARRDEAIFWLRDIKKGLVSPMNIVDSSTAVTGGLEGVIVSSDTPRGW